jgi:uncharacterized protein YdhG (YjbR/CyaY superfamily)
MNKEVNEYIEKQKSPQNEIIKKVREIFKKTLPTSEEKMRWGVITYSKGKFYIAAMKNRVHVGFAISGLSNDEIRLFEGTGKTMKHIKIPKLADIDENKLVNLIEMVEKKAICNPY